MPVRRFLKDGVLHIVAEGTYAYDEVMRAFREGLREDGCQLPARVLLDVTKSRSLATRTTEEVRRAGDTTAALRSEISRFAVVAATTVNFGLARQGTAYVDAGGLETRVFRTREEALAWLG